MSQFLSHKARRIVPYVPGEQPKAERLIKLNTNENPYPPSPRVREAMAAQVDKLRLYPEIDGETLRAAIARREGVQMDQVFVGNGSDEVLSLCFPAFFDPDCPVRFPEITYTFYKVYAELFDIPFVTTPMQEGLRVDVEGLLSGGGPVILANPNAPTSLALPLEEIERMAARQLDKGKVLVVDEAYIAFGDQPSAVTLIQRYPNLLVTRTMSKDHSLAGLRVGYAIAQRPLIEGLIRVKDSFNSYPLDRLAIAGATAAIEDEAYFALRLQQVKQTRDWFYEALIQRGFVSPRSSANFVFAKHATVPGKLIFDQLRARAILVRRFDKPQIEDYLRITIGTQEQMEEVLRALDEILAQAR